nr:uncharacterized protein LOC100183204 isoform X1 [Ciona intestinalis]|eukprot:XP_026691903.1 uncharacterized protein LOC100183204 isoform X1 [Ciona intestinalis]
MWIVASRLGFIILCCLALSVKSVEQNENQFVAKKKCFEKTCCYISGENPQRPKIIDETCYSGPGHDYRGLVSKSERGRPCLNWMRTIATNLPKREMKRYGVGNHSYCRNPEPTENRGPWCYVSHNNYGYCDVVSCLHYPKLNYNEVIAPPSCNTQLRGHFDFLFSFNNTYHYLSNRRGLKNAELFSFSDVTMTLIATLGEQPVSEIWNLCLRSNDTLTFVTTDSSHNLYAYFQFPNVFLRLVNNIGWAKVDGDVFENCMNLVHATARQGASSQETLFRSVFDFHRPHDVIIETNGRRITCEWENGELVFVSEEAAHFQLCDLSSTLFVDINNDTYAIHKAGSISGNCSQQSHSSSKSSQSVCITDVLQAVDRKPGLAAPLLGYKPLDSSSVLRLYDVGDLTTVQALEFCVRDGPRSRLYKVYAGSQIIQLADWIGSRNVQKQLHITSNVWIQINSINTRRADFCNRYNKTSCCHQVLQSFRQARQNNRASYGKTNQQWISCKLRIHNTTQCPDLHCFFNKDINMYANELHQVACEIRLQPDPVVSNNVSAEDILGITDGEGVNYIDADDASAKLGEIADTLRDTKGNLNLGVLINSVEALKPVNYSAVSSTGIKRLITNFVTIMDDMVDEGRADEWKEIKEEENGPESSQPEFATTTIPPQQKQSDPHSLLFITENVLQRFVMDSTATLWSKFDQGLTVTTNNVISVIEKPISNASNTSTQDTPTLTKVNLNVDPDVASDESTVVITSLFPRIINLISEVNSGKTSQLPTTMDGSNRRFVPSAPVLSATVLQKGKITNSAVHFIVPYNASDIPDAKKSDEKYYFNCMYLTLNNDWDTRGCHVVNVNTSNKTVTCACNHTTNFAILLQVVPPKLTATDTATLQLISYIGESLSVFCLIITLTTFTAFRHSLKSERMVAHFHLVISLILFHVVQLFSAKAEQYKDTTAVPCIIVAFATHFSLLVTFMWMLCEGITLHLNVVNVFHAMTKFKLARYFIGWGIPLVIASTTMAYGLSQSPYPTCYVQGVGEQSCPGSRGNTGMSTDAQPEYQVIEWCWLSTDNYLVWALVIPALLVLTLNTIVLFRVSAVIAQSSKASNKLHVPLAGRKDEELEHIRKSLKGAFVLMPILGIPWVFGFIPQSLTHVALLYIFTVLNSTQGIFILLFYCILNTEVRTVVVRCLRKQNLLHRKQKSWASQSNYRHSVDLRQINRNDNSDFDQQMGVERSVSVHTSSTYCGGVAPSSGDSLTGSFQEQTSFLPQTTVKHLFVDSYARKWPRSTVARCPEDACTLIRSSSLRCVETDNVNNGEPTQCRKTWHSSNFQ